MSDHLREKLLSVGLQTAQRLIDYDSYGKREYRAVAAMRKRVPGFSREEYSQTLRDTIVIHKEALAFVKTHRREFFRLYEKHKSIDDFHLISGDFIASHSDYPRDSLMALLTFIFYYWHLR